ncbi:PREDICTED: uncharacterized protein LOC105452772 [Wasmannia auropunctata]|uniref:uncharacterized protein LOC105452772 n=1 Tax=Wasmannia auropunctata TaxID=64793 RepID=UPI0005EFF1CE|nr:PREDICTED: uncharacterized protein LOC105452772 [Wasmannia auropunctata]XP_011692467.1 PREDICTED: uncharacterized protein LOC105452772 [Wasmannia auropunctata]XP_011692468.1 PREDICTED: uncharacterized protein LOC105452772 [Wasmannia auropunctata]XP_011692469.1 PREDICTED: uncharacterized protein LOC105452772 [Wasmannia auropunctata]
MEIHGIDEEDEDVVIQGSALHEHLSRLGYTDYETVPMPKKTYFKRERYLNIDIKSTVKKIYAKLFSLYSWLTQEKSISERQLIVILNAEALLNDHFSVINSFTIKSNNSSKKITLQELIVTGACISSTCVSLCEQKILPTLFASFAICCIGYMKYLRFYANRNLKNVILLQNELFIMCKDGLKILRHDYKMKLGFGPCLQQFSHFLGEKLQYLESLKDALIKFMENISCVYYKCSLSIAKLLPPDALSEELFTKFECNSFEASGEINYQTLKRLYHTYLLVQSEMLYLLAIAYNSRTWISSCRKIPETELAYIIHILAKELAVYKVKLSEIMNAYRTCKTEPVRYKTQGKAKWHDPTVQLDLASYKLQLAYNQVFSTFKDIDDCINQDNGIDNETADTLMQKLDKAFKEIDTAKSLAEFVVLLMARSRFSDLRNSQSVTDDATINENPNLPVIIDSDPQILDEVFEEYIKEEYSKSLDDDTDEYSLEQRKLDKLLAKNFMSELKEALVDKRKSMSEREFRALQRICKNVSREPASSTEDNKDCQIAPAPPPMPPHCIWSTRPSDINLDRRNVISPIYKIRNDDSSIQEKSDESDEENDLVRALKQKNTFSTWSIEVCDNKDEESILPLPSLPQVLLETQATRFITKVPPFLHEETFIGSGENSEDEITSNSSDNEKNVYED